ncbi:MAG: 23S rRNA pseudouridine(2605) synthase RluB [Gammaproteobacteria bacterium]
MSERIQKVLAQAGYGSRREIESWIRAGRIRINGQLAQLGDRVVDSDRIVLDDKPVRVSSGATKKRRVIVYHKPEGEICSRSDPERRPTIFDRLPKIQRGRWIAVGRLDLNTSGLILLTTDGELANRLMHPSSEIEREYAVRVLGTVDKPMLNRLKRGVMLEDGMAAFSSIKDAGGTGANHWYHVVLKEGRTREVRRLWESQEVRVSRLIRVRFANITLNKGLRSGRWQELSEIEIEKLQSQIKANSLS